MDGEAFWRSLAVLRRYRPFFLLLRLPQRGNLPVSWVPGAGRALQDIARHLQPRRRLADQFGGAQRPLPQFGGLQMGWDDDDDAFFESVDWCVAWRGSGLSLAVRPAW